MCSRVLVFVLPTVVLQSVPGTAVLARAALAVSGLLGWAAVCCLAMNLWQTAQHAGRKGH
jgi:ABC-type Co2+ transport system permease subunit